MVPADVVNPLLLIGREIRIECTTVLDEKLAGKLARRSRGASALLPDQRPDDLRAIERRKAEAVLSAVRLGAVRR